MTTNRRSFIKAAGSLTVMFSLEYTGLLASALTMNNLELPEVLRRNPSLSAWLQVLTNGSVRVFTGKVELGQGLCGAIAQVTAEELDLKADKVEVVIADTRRTPNEGFTGGSFSTENSVLSIRYAAAAARRELLDLAAAVLMAPAEELQMADGKVSFKSGGRSLSFFELLEGKKLKSEIRLPLQLKPKEQYRISGKSVHREDFKQMVVGAEMYIQDLRFPGMVHARTISPPSYDARLISLDEAGLNKVAPVLTVIKDGSFIAVICEDEYQTVKAQQHLSAQAKWSVSQKTTSAKSMPELLKSLTVITSKVKTASIVFPEEAKTIKAAYYKPYVMHGAIAPSCAVARYKDGLLEIWTHSQGAYPLRDTISSLVKIPTPQIHVTCIRGSGCYGHNGSDDAAAEAALIAVAFPGRHIRLQWSREQEHSWEPYGTAMYMELEAILAMDGRIAHFRNSVWSDAHYIRGNPGYLNLEGLRANPVVQKANPAGSGGYRNADLYYAVSNQTVTANFFNGPLRTSNLRSLGSYANLFAVESFMDELAAQAGIDPFDFRIMHLEDKRAIEVLERLKRTVITLPKEKNAAIGIAFSRYKNSAAYIAVAAQVKVHPSTFKITPVKLWAVVDVGEVISLDSVINQIEGGMIQATSWTLFEEVRFEQKTVNSRNWASYPIIRFNDIPEVEVEVISRPNEKLQGVGEIAMCVTPGAIANAINRACGKRIRNLPVGEQLKL
ncbi:xanthine dehydrogenase family protein molybdopterin-binding subunit [Pedobacter psychroterrae]|uniref:Xanthine dehydrogenase family protein molybdopterin-binding subunit n=1 Tax=Pedobacter psychroterrae TaxID=2530453 RepID=A0A4V2MKX3_9SPHI|nr:molybdopterin cofactor-binding domain-containing protein [Pedobacter psychroterrae]TCC99896.1 xanthine dehydrogenase family protein molybdopterin-binding subunit [Pedobacter psychroterrae]